MDLHVERSDPHLIAATLSFVKDYMSSPIHDASHDFDHIQRVLSMANHILKVEAASVHQPTESHDGEGLENDQNHRPRMYNPAIVTLAALLHDVGDHKYSISSESQANKPHSHGSNCNTSQAVESGEVYQFLVSANALTEVARAVQTIVTHVSYSFETRHCTPAAMRGVLEQHPELAIVQDADRLDAIGAIGIGRTFTYGGAKDPGRGMEGSVRHIEEKLVKLESLMKTREGKRIAKQRTERIRIFLAWWKDESGNAEQ